MAIAGVVGGVLGSVIPIVGTIAGSWFGMMAAGAWGSIMAGEIVDSQKLESYKRECYGALQQALGSAYQSATSQVNILISDMQAEASSLLQKMMQQANENLVKTRNDLNQRQKATQQDIALGHKTVDSHLIELATLKKSLESFHAAVFA